MILQIIVLRDIKANVYGQPVFVPNIGAAIRSFGDQIKDPNAGDLNKHPEDFELWHIGEYDDATGEICDYNAQNREMADGVQSLRKQIAVGSNYK